MKISCICLTAATILISSSCEERDGNCFLGETLVGTPTKAVTIEQLRPGDIVESFDPKTGLIVEAKVTSNRASRVNGYLEVRSASGMRLKVTSNHPFWTGDERGFREIGGLGPGDHIYRFENGSIVLDVIEEIQPVSTAAIVYDLAIDREPHTFFANRYLVHNKPPPYTGPVAFLTVTPPSSGRVRADGRIVDPGVDASILGPDGGVISLEALPSDGWKFERWEGEVADPDSQVTTFTMTDGLRLTCLFSSTPGWE